MKHLIVIPAFNEEEALRGTLASLQSLPPEFEIVVVNDGSRDSTGELAEAYSASSKLPVYVLNLPRNCGIGGAVQTGYLFAQKRKSYHYVIQFDADGQHDAAFIPQLIEACETQNLDVCIGSRFLAPEPDGFRSSFLRRVGIRFFCRLIGFLSGVQVTDPTSGFRCAGPKAWQHFARHYPEDYPEPESLFWCVRNGLKIGEVAVRMKERQGGVSSIRYLKTAYYMIKVSLAIMLDRLRAKGR